MTDTHLRPVARSIAAATEASPPFDDTTDLDDARRGFLSAPSPGQVARAADLTAAGDLTVDGATDALDRLTGVLEPPGPAFAIVLP